VRPQNLVGLRWVRSWRANHGQQRAGALTQRQAERQVTPAIAPLTSYGGEGRSGVGVSPAMTATSLGPFPEIPLLGFVGGHTLLKSHRCTKCGPLLRVLQNRIKTLSEGFRIIAMPRGGGETHIGHQ
jgi:hypothetical protein